MEHSFTQLVLAAGMLLVLSQAAYAGGINSPAGVDVPIGAGGTPVIMIKAPTMTMPAMVGIMNPTPAYTLDVNGNFNLNGVITSGSRIFMQRDAGNYSWIGAQGTGTDAERDAIGFTSEPDTGKTDAVLANANLAVNGSVKVSNDSSSCTNSNAGSIRWHGTALEGCNGTNWGSLGGRGSLKGTVEYLACDDAPTTWYCRAGWGDALCNSAPPSANWYPGDPPINPPPTCNDDLEVVAGMDASILLSKGSVSQWVEQYALPCGDHVGARMELWGCVSQ